MLAADPYPAFDYLKLGQLGDLFGLSATAVGMKLKQIGLRQPNGDPTQRARDARLVNLVRVEGMHPFWTWEKVRTVQVLEAAGCRRAGATHSPEPPTAEVEKVIGPFEPRPSDTEGDGWEIADANGIVAVWVRGERVARRLAAVMTLADRCGKL
jgi:hypothetical protein